MDEIRRLLVEHDQIDPTAEAFLQVAGQVELEPFEPRLHRPAIRSCPRTPVRFPVLAQLPQ